MQEVIDLHNNMKPVIKFALTPEQIDLPIRDLGIFEADEVRELQTWLKGVYDKQYKELHRIFKLPADDTLWEKYRIFGVYGLPEQKLFDQAAKEFRKVWLKPYRPKRKIVNAAPEETDNSNAHRNQDSVESVGVQPQN